MAELSLLSTFWFCGLFSLSYSLSNGNLRLVDGPSSNKGRVEVYYDGEWGTICDDSWHWQDADLVCRQLGYESVERHHYRAYYGEGTGRIWIDQIHCDRTDSSILECKHLGWGVNDCKHFEDAAVDCKRIEAVKPRDLPVRLSCPDSSACGSCTTCADTRFPNKTDCLPQAAVEGIVEVFYDNQWRPLYNNGWDMSSANVVCGELGYPLAMSIPTMDELWCNWNCGQRCDIDCIEAAGSGNDPLTDATNVTCNAEFRRRMGSAWIKELECTGMENRLLDCYIKAFGPTLTSSMNVATVRCGYSAHPECKAANTSTEMYRTRGSAVPWKGRVEVRIGGVWGTVYDTRWDLTDASIVCRALGYGSASRATHRSNFGRGVGAVHFTYMDCAGSETLLSECKSRSVVYTQTHGNDAGVECMVPQRSDACGEPQGSKISTDTDTRGYYGTNFVEVHGPNGWGLLCFESLDFKAATVICRESAGMFPLRIRRASHRNTTKTRYTWSLVCTGEEESLHDCQQTLLATAKCGNQEGVVDCTSGIADLVPHLEVFERSLHNHYLYDMPMYYLGCAQEENCLSSSARGKPFNHRRRLLRFSSQTMNYGTTNFEPLLSPREWIWHSCHAHYHSFEAFIHYDLIDPVTGNKAAEGHKASFCLEDSYCEGGVRPSFRCSYGVQGISANCGDLYGSHLDCQWIDVTDIPPGRYIIRQTVNPDGLGVESDYRNNVAECTIEWGLRGYYTYLLQVVPGSCHVSDH